MTEPLSESSSNLYHLDPQADGNKYYDIILSIDLLEDIKALSRKTYSKILNAEVASFESDEDEITSPVTLHFRKIKGLSVREQKGFKEAMSPSQKISFMIFAAQMKEKYFIEDLKLNQLLLDPTLWKQFTPEEQDRLGDIAKLTTDSSQDYIIHNLSVFLKSRLNPQWTIEDTESLTDALYTQFLYFMDKESRGWIEKKPSTQPQTSTDKKSKGQKKKKN